MTSPARISVYNPPGSLEMTLWGRSPDRMPALVLNLYWPSFRIQWRAVEPTTELRSRRLFAFRVWHVSALLETSFLMQGSDSHWKMRLRILGFGFRLYLVRRWG